MFDFGIQWIRDVVMPDDEYGENHYTVIRFRCGCEWFGDARQDWLGEVAVAAPDCPREHVTREWDNAAWDFETEEERLDREWREEQARQAAWEQYLASEKVRNEQKKAFQAQNQIDGRPVTREDVLAVVHYGGNSILADEHSFRALYGQKLILKKPVMQLDGGMAVYRIRKGLKRLKRASRSSI